MPNHIHFIAVIKETYSKSYQPIIGLSPLNPKSVSSFTNHFKGKIKRWCNENNLEHFEWQSRFHDRVIRNEQEYNAIANYIRANVANWAKDMENPCAPENEIL